ncbi:MAG: hypothetical protein KatS3mg084_0066 [Candidatus Dojkabacteria bacterium]|jgi:hypothetical protein|nr:MAG: hypothetical protein KatS3mg084_0066 [Candidatus Dojkabacteria bacterium]
MERNKQPKVVNTLELRKIKKAQDAKIIKTLIGLGVALLLLFLLVLVAVIWRNDFRQIPYLDQIGTQKSTDKIVDSEDIPSTPTNVPTEASINVTLRPLEEQILDRNFNDLVFYPEGFIYNIKIRKDTVLTLINNTGAPLGLEFSDGRTVSLHVAERKSMIFSQSGTYSFYEIGTNTAQAIEGTIIVVP